MPSRTSRDLGLRRIGVSTRLLAGGSLLAGGVLSVAVAKALPGKTSHARSTSTVAPSTSSPSGGTSGSQSTSSTTTPSSSLTAPAQSPQAASGSTPVVSSGGS